MKVGLLGIVHTFWRVVGMRRVGTILKRIYPSAYGDTVFSFPFSSSTSVDQRQHKNNNNNEDDDEDNNGFVALTIDDGLCRNIHGKTKKEDGGDGDGDDNDCCSMVQEVSDLLASYNAHATFFVCQQYTKGSDAQILLESGNELGNHLQEDMSGYYFRLSKEEFRKSLREMNEYLKDECSVVVTDDLKWFRAPQGIMTKSMKEVIKSEGMINVLGDVYCDDWAFAEYCDDSSNIGGGGDENTAAIMKKVATLMLGQVQPGSIAIFHMPERRFREGCFDALKEFLEGIQERGMRCVSLTEMTEHCSKSTPT